jgi:hypothetical protein
MSDGSRQMLGNIEPLTDAPDLQMEDGLAILLSIKAAKHLIFSSPLVAIAERVLLI